MTFENVLEMVKALGNDAIHYVDSEKTIHVDINDFEGFNDDWDEIYRDFDDEDAINGLFRLLEKNANSIDDDYYIVFHFDDFKVSWGYTSYDI